MTQPLDLDELMDRLGGDQELIALISRQFLDDCGQLMAGIQGALQTRDAEALTNHAHTLKGSVGNFCADPCYEAAQALEAMGRASEWTDVEEAWVVLQEAMAALMPELDKLCACPA